MTSARLGNVVLATALTMALLPASVIVAQGSPLSDAEADALIADIEAQVAEAEAALEELGSVRMDAGAVIEAVGSDPEAIADWVAQGTPDSLIEAELLGSEAQPNLWRRLSMRRRSARSGS